MSGFYFEKRSPWGRCFFGFYARDIPKNMPILYVQLNSTLRGGVVFHFLDMRLLVNMLSARRALKSTSSEICCGDRETTVDLKGQT